MPTRLMPAHLIRERILRDFRIIGRGRTLRGPYRPRLSSAGKCVRALSYHRQSYPESDPTPAVVGLRFEMGDALHHYLDTKMRGLGLPLELREHRLGIPASFGVITGHFDRSIGGTTVLDYKSASDVSFRMMLRQNTPLSDHRAQLNGYLHACRITPGLEQYTHGLIVAINKDTQDLWVSPPVERDPELAQATIAKFEEVERHAAAGTLPARPFDSPGEWPCKGCPWRRLCWGDALPAAAAEPPADLRQLAETARAYVELGEEIKALERDRERAAGAIRAALTDAGSRRGVAGPYDVALATYNRTSLNPDLVPPEIRAQATVETQVTQLRFTERVAETAEVVPAEPRL